MRIRVKASVGRLPPTVAEIDRHPREKKGFFRGNVANDNTNDEEDWVGGDKMGG